MHWSVNYIFGLRVNYCDKHSSQLAREYLLISLAFEKTRVHAVAARGGKRVLRKIPFYHSPTYSSTLFTNPGRIFNVNECIKRFTLEKMFLSTLRCSLHLHHKDLCAT